MTWPILSQSLVTVHSFSPNSMALELASLGVKLISPASAAYPTANMAYYLPFWLGSPLKAVQMFAWNGAAVSGNIDVGIYAADGTKIVSSGSTAQAGTNVLQAFDITDTQLGRGNFYLAVAIDNTTGTLFRPTTPAFRVSAGLGQFQQASAFALPAVATFARLTALYYPVIGFSTRAVL